MPPRSISGLPKLAVIATLAICLLPAFAAGSAPTVVEPLKLVDINQATVPELLQVPGMTAVWATRIVRFRPYRTKLDLLDQGVVTPEVYRRIRDSVVAHRIPQKK